MSDKLPPLPMTEWRLHMPAGPYEEAWTSYQGGYSEDDMHTYAAAATAAAVAAERAWRNTVDDMLTVCHAVASDDPRESINRLINWHVAVALDPAVSSDAAALVADERERCAKLCEDIGDAYQAREAYKWAEQRTDAQSGAHDCAAAIRQAPAE